MDFDNGVCAQHELNRQMGKTDTLQDMIAVAAIAQPASFPSVNIFAPDKFSLAPRHRQKAGYVSPNHQISNKNSAVMAHVKEMRKRKFVACHDI